MFKEAFDMQISKREFLKKVGLLGVAGVTGAALSDEYVPSSGKIPPVLSAIRPFLPGRRRYFRLSIQ